MLLSYDTIFQAVRENIRRGYWRNLYQHQRNAAFAQFYSSRPNPIMIGRRHPAHGQMYLIDGQARLTAALMGTGIKLPEQGESFIQEVIEYLERAGVEVTDPGTTDARENWSRAMQALIQAFRIREREHRMDLRQIRPQGQSLQNPCAEIALEANDLSTLGQPNPLAEQDYIEEAQGGEVSINGSPWPNYITPDQHKFVAAALFLWMEGTTNHHSTVDRDIVLKLCHRPPNKRQRQTWNRRTISVAAGNLVSCFYSSRYPVQWWPQYRNMVGYMMRSSPISRVAACSFCIYLSGLIYDAIGLGKAKMPHAWRTEPVIGILKGMKADVALDRGPILADALQDAGCDKDDLLNHLRTGPISLGSWLFRSTGIM